jgi:hypothetical protein
LFEEARRLTIEEYGMQDKLAFDKDKLDEVCRYQRSVESLREYYHNEVDVFVCDPIMDKITNEYGISTTWQAGRPMVFPPHLSFIYIADENDTPFLVKREDFYEQMSKHLIEIVNFLPDMYILKAKSAKKARKVLHKLRKLAILDQNFKPVRLSNLLDA